MKKLKARKAIQYWPVPILSGNKDIINARNTNISIPKERKKNAFRHSEPARARIVADNKITE
jgi:hypothetical protein